jgi:hypothetical protein
LFKYDSLMFFFRYIKYVSGIGIEVMLRNRLQVVMNEQNCYCVS